MFAKFNEIKKKGILIVMASDGKKIIGVQVPDFLRENLEREAEELSISVSAMIRLILAQRYRNVAKLTSEEEK